MSNCIYCETELSDRGFFCKACGKQSTCSVCKERLELDAGFCTICGTKIGVPADAAINSVFGNTFELTESTENNGSNASRTIKLVCSDEAVSNFGDFVERRIRTPQFGSSDVDQRQFLPPGNSDDPAEKGSPGFEERITPPASSGSELDALHTVFRKDGDAWKIDEIYLNATGKGEYGKRLTFLFLYLNELEGTPKTLRSDLNKILEDSTVYDGNFKHWVANEASINNDGDSLSLNAAGRRAAKEHILQVTAEKVTNQWLPGMTSTKRPSGKSNSQSEPEEKETGKKSFGKRNLSGKKLAAQWNALKLSIDAHNTFAARSDCDKGLLALWAIRKATHDGIKEVSSQGMNTFLFEAFELQVHKRSLERGLKSEAAKGLALNRKGTTFQILPPGIEHIDKILNL